VGVPGRGHGVLPGGVVSAVVRRLVSASGNGSWPALNLGARPSAGTGELPGAAAGSADLELTDWFQRRFAQAPPTAEQLAGWQRLARVHQRDLRRGWLCGICAVAYPCVFRVLAHAALAAAQGDEDEFDADPAVRLAARMVAAERAEQGCAAVVAPLLADCLRVVATHRPNEDRPGVCPVCGTGFPVGWPCDLYGLAMQVVSRFGAYLPGQVDGR
jgi:hypothetical protein